MYSNVTLDGHDLFNMTTSSSRGASLAMNSGSAWARALGKGTIKVEAATFVPSCKRGGVSSNFFALLASVDRGNPISG